MEAESTAVHAFACEEAEGLAQKIALLEDEPVEMHQAREVAEENSRGLSDTEAAAK
jgi:hypothetical protein